MDRVHIRAEWIGRHLPGASGWVRSRTPDRQSRVRRSSGLLARCRRSPSSRRVPAARLISGRSTSAHRAKALTSGPGGDFRPAWSPDGQWIAFWSDRTAGLQFSHGQWKRSRHRHFSHSPGRFRREAAHGPYGHLRQLEVVGRQSPPDRVLQHPAGDDGFPAAGGRDRRGATRVVTIDVATAKVTDVSAGSWREVRPRSSPAPT